MRLRGTVVHLAVGVVLLLALLATTITPTSAQSGYASLTIHNRICPVEYDGGDLFADCHGTPPASSLDFFIDGPISASAATDDAGNVVFADVPAGIYDVSGGLTADIAGSRVYCSVNDDPENTLPVSWTDTGVALDIPDGASVLCDWYNIPYALPEASEDDGAEEPPAESADEPAPLVPVWVEVYNCDADPGVQDPALVCDPAPGVTVEASQDDEPLATVSTNDAGGAMVEAEAGTTVVLAEDMGTVPAGYLPLSGGVRTFEAVAGGEFALFVHVAVGEADAGRLQIVNGSCPTSDDEPRTEFNVIGPPAVEGASSAPCLPTPNAPFTISGDNLPAGALAVSTGDDGAWRGTIPAGTYTVTDDSGANQTVEVLAGETTVVTAVDYVPYPDGTLRITKFRCTEGEEAGTTITIDEPAEEDPACAPAGGEVRLIEIRAGDGTAVAVEVIPLGADGAAELTLRTGDYRLTDLSSGETATFTIGESTTTTVTVRDVVIA